MRTDRTDDAAAGSPKTQHSCGSGPTGPTEPTFELVRKMDMPNGAASANASPVNLPGDLQKPGSVGSVGSRPPNAPQSGRQQTATDMATPPVRANRETLPGFARFAPVRPNAATAGSKRQQRKVAKHAARVDRWRAEMPEAERLPFYSPAALELELKTSIQTLAPALRALGWRRVQTRITGVQCVVWVAPGEISPLRDRGRPPTVAAHPRKEPTT